MKIVYTMACIHLQNSARWAMTAADTKERKLTKELMKLLEVEQ
ncbi:MAG: hypothetical protein PUJ07_01315 [Eubacteriales bacterium]|nr:hypothetical protein [Eubacteriales bacterium]